MPELYGEWGNLVRELADFNPSRYHEVARWPLAEALAAFEARLKARLWDAYKIAFQSWSALAATGATKRKKPPDLPAILREG